MANWKERFGLQPHPIDLSLDKVKSEYVRYLSENSAKVLQEAELRFQEVSELGLAEDLRHSSGQEYRSPLAIVNQVFQGNPYLLELLNIDFKTVEGWEIIFCLFSDLMASGNFRQYQVQVYAFYKQTVELKLKLNHDYQAWLEPIAHKYFGHDLSATLVPDLYELACRVFKGNFHLELEKRIYQQYILDQAIKLIIEAVDGNKKVEEKLAEIRSKLIMVECVEPYYDDWSTLNYGPSCVAVGGMYVITHDHTSIREGQYGFSFLDQVQDGWHVDRVEATAHEVFHALVKYWLNYMYIPAGGVPEPRSQNIDDFIEPEVKKPIEKDVKPEWFKGGKLNNLGTTILEGTAMVLDFALFMFISEGTKDQLVLNRVKDIEKRTGDGVMDGIQSMKTKKGRYRPNLAYYDPAVRYSEGALIARHLARKGWRLNQIDVLLDELSSILGDKNLNTIGVSKKSKSTYIKLIHKIKALEAPR